MITSILPLLASCSGQIHPETINALIKTESDYNPNAIALIKGNKDLDIGDKLKSSLLINEIIKSNVIKPVITIGFTDQSRVINSMNELMDAFDSGKNVTRLNIAWDNRSLALSSQPQAVEIIGLLDKINANYSVGLGQVNRGNFKAYNVTGAQLLDPCTNLTVSQSILKKCFIASPNHKVSEALSCYYAGNFTFGFKKESGINSSYTQRVANNFVPENQITVPSIGSELDYIKQRNSAPKSGATQRSVAKVKSHELKEKKEAVQITAIVKNGHIYDVKQGITNDVLASNEQSNKQIFK